MQSKDLSGLLKEQKFCVGAASEGKNVKLRSSLDQCLEDIMKTGLLQGKMQVQSLGQEDPLEEGHGNPLQYSCVENSTDRGV